MVIKGGSRAGPKQLAGHLLRADTNERVEVLELYSPIGDLHETFREWQALASGTRGTLGLYHANIDPAKDYAMTQEQWLRSVNVLEKELGLEGQPRAVVLHEKHGRQHIHVVWQRTDVDNMKLIDDGMNYPAHERASQQLEREFGHEPVPGKHAKRDRDKQPEFPRQEMTHAEWQQKERTGMDPRDRKEQITELYERSDTAQAFKAALEEQGYILAQGDRRPYVIVDAYGQTHSLTAQILRTKPADKQEFLRDIAPASLPNITEAQRIQEERAKHREAQAEATKAKEAKTPELEQQPKQEPQQETDDDRRFREALQARQAQQTQHLVDEHTRQTDEARQRLDADIKEKMDKLAETQDTERRRLQKKHAREESILTRIDRKLRPDIAADRDQKRQKARDDLAERHRDQHQDQITQLRQARDTDIDRIIQKQMKEMAALNARHTEETERHRQEREAAVRAREIENERQREEDLKRSRDGPDLGPTR